MKAKTLAAARFFKDARKGLLLCYALVLLCWLVRGAAFFAYDTAQPVQVLAPENAEMIELAPDGEWLVSTGYDAQLIFNGIEAPVRRVLLRCTFEDVPGEIDAYYTRTAEEGFSPRQRVVGRPVAEGYVFDLPAGQVYSLRIDPTNLFANQVQVYEVVLNPESGFWPYIAPSLRNLLGFAIWPALAYCVIFTIIEMTETGARHPHAPRKSEET